MNWLLWILLLTVAPTAVWSSKTPLNESYLSRPYVLPKSSVRVLLENERFVQFQNLESDSFKTENQTFIIRPEWHTPYGDNIYFIWKILPAGVGYLLPSKENEQVSAEWCLDWGAGRVGYFIAPTFIGRRKWLVSRNLGFEVALEYSYVYPTSEAYSYWKSGVKFGPAYQVTSKFALGLELNPLVSNVYLAKLYKDSSDPRLGRAVSQMSAALWTNTTFSRWLAWHLQFKATYEQNPSELDYWVQNSLEIYF